jgi:hypothetical protein
MSLKHVLAALTCLTLAPVSALAQENPPEEEVVVRADGVDEAIRSFVGAVTVEAGRTDQIAVWGGRLCIGVMGMRGPQAQAVIDRIATHADSLSVDLGQPGCSPNLLVIFTTDSDQVARVLVEEYRRVLAYHVTDGVSRGRTALEDFASTPRAVRWWHVSAAADETGAVARDRRGIGGPPAVTTSAGGSRIENATQQVFTRAIIVVDSTRVAGMRVDTLADYISMAALAQLDPTADTSAYPTILNAFRDGSPGNAQLTLTDWDQAYLEGLYTSPTNRDASFQRRGIQRAIRGGN